MNIRNHQNRLYFWIEQAIIDIFIFEVVFVQMHSTAIILIHHVTCNIGWCWMTIFFLTLQVWGQFSDTDFFYAFLIMFTFYRASLKKSIVLYRYIMTGEYPLSLLHSHQNNSCLKCWSLSAQIIYNYCWLKVWIESLIIERLPANDT